MNTGAEPGKLILSWEFWEFWERLLPVRFTGNSVLGIFGNFGNFSETYCDWYCRNMEREKLPDPALHNGWRALFGVGGCGRYEFTERAGRESAERRSLII